MGALIHVKSNTIGDFTGTVTVMNSAGATESKAATNLVLPSDWNSAHQQNWTLGGNTHTAGVSSFSATNVVVAGGNNVTLSAATAAAAATISIIGPAVATLSAIEVKPGAGATAALSLGHRSLYLEPFVLPQHGSFLRMQWLASLTLANSSSFTSQSTRSNGWTQGHTAVLYSQGTGTNSSRIESISSFTGSIGASNLYGHSSNGASATANHTYQFAGLNSVDSNGGVTYTTTSFTSSSSTGANSSVTVANVGNTFWQGVRMFPMPFAMSMTPGNYWMGIMVQSSSTSSGVNSNVMSASKIVVTSQSNSYTPLMASNTISSTQSLLGHGMFSTTRSDPPATIAFTDIRQVASNPHYIFNLMNQTL